MKLVVPIAAGLAAVSLGVPSAASAKVTKLKISLVTVKQQLIDVPPTQAANQPPDDGDYIVFTDRVVSKGKTIGTNKGICSTGGFPEFLCTTTARLTRGHDRLPRDLQRHLETPAEHRGRRWHRPLSRRAGTVHRSERHRHTVRRHDHPPGVSAVSG
jgi:hypothetical protein